ncbi:hypothetical protein CPC08DRAFT_670406, partial [Agrocybe pediades]
MTSNTTNTRSQANGVPSTSTFSFKAPFPVSPASAASVSALKHRRVSLASPSSPRLVKPFSFRDEMGIQQQDGAVVATTSSSTSTNANATASSASVPEKKGKMRKIDTSQSNTNNSDESSPPVQEKKPRKKWSSEETQMLVEGCQIHGVGNWKTILQDPDLKFHDRSAVDLKDRFRTYFPDAYKKHYPNARTHLSSKIRSTFADGTSLFEKTRSKRRRPFTEAEDRALKAGYEKHGTTWATIVKDPIFQEQNRRSTDLRDRFRNAFPDLYQAAGYKPRTAAKKKLGLGGPLQGADDWQVTATSTTASTTGPVRSRRHTQSSRSVPQSTVPSEDELELEPDEESSEEEGGAVGVGKGKGRGAKAKGKGKAKGEHTYTFKTPMTPVFVDSTHSFRQQQPKRPVMNSTSHSAPAAVQQSASSSTESSSSTNDPSASFDDEDDEMHLVVDSAGALDIPDFLPTSTSNSSSNVHSDMETWPSSSGLNTPTHSSSTAAWSTAAASPTSSQVSDFFMSNSSGGAHTDTSSSSPFIEHRRSEFLGGSSSGNGSNGNGSRNNFGMIGKSAWGNDWFSPNPKLEGGSTNNPNSSSSSSSFIDHHSDAGGFSPSSPFGYHPHLNHGVLDRYDLFPPTMPDGSSMSEVGYGDSHTFGEEMGFGFGFGAGGAAAFGAAAAFGVGPAGLGLGLSGFGIG